MAILTSGSFPAGSSPAFIDAMLRQQRQTQDTGKKTDDNATQLSQVQQAVNALSSDLNSVSSTANSAMNTANTAAQQAAQALRAANNAGNGVGDINMNAVFKNVTATQTVGGPFGATQFNVGGAKVVGARSTGWAPVAGGEQRGGLNADQGFPAGGSYSQGEVQAIGAGLTEARRHIAAIYNALAGHGLIG